MVRENARSKSDVSGFSLFSLMIMETKHSKTEDIKSNDFLEERDLVSLPQTH